MENDKNKDVLDEELINSIQKDRDIEQEISQKPSNFNNKNTNKRKKLSHNRNIENSKKDTKSKQKKRKLTKAQRERKEKLFVFKFFFIVICLIALVIFLYTYKAFNIEISDNNVKGNNYSNNYSDTLSKYSNRNLFSINKGNLERKLKNNNLIEFNSVKKYTKSQEKLLNKIKAEQKKYRDGKKVNNNLLNKKVEHKTKKNKSISIIDKVIIKKRLPNKLEIIIKEKEPVCCFNTPNGKYLINNTGRIFYKLKINENPNGIYTNIPVVYSDSNDIFVGEEITKINHICTTNLFELARLSYQNNLNIKTIQMKGKFEAILTTKNGTLINFGLINRDLLDKAYFLKQILKEKANLLDDISEIYIIDSTQATYKLKKTKNGQDYKN